jgi:hypothetical protein
MVLVFFKENAMSGPKIIEDTEDVFYPETDRALGREHQTGAVDRCPAHWV